ncbi:hypothetical protein SCALM49S_05891 [Streptomyces californicus]
MRSTSSILSASMSYAIVTWCRTAPGPPSGPTTRFCAAPAILPTSVAMSLSGWYHALMPMSARASSTQSSR